MFVGNLVHSSERSGAVPSGLLSASWTPASSQSRHVGPRPPRRRALIVEDDPDHADLMRRMLDSCNVGYEFASNVAQARSRLEQEGFDIVLLDLGLPDSRPLDVIARVLPVSLDAPVVAITALDESEMAQTCLEHGVEAYIAKSGLTTVALSRVIEHAITRRKAATMAQRLEAAERHASLGKIAAGIVHEVRNQSTVLMGNNDFVLQQVRELAGKLDDGRFDEVLEALEDSQAAILQIENIVSDLRSFASGKRPLTIVDVSIVAERAMRLLDRKIRRFAQPVITVDHDAKVLADDGQLLQILINLVNNAVDAIEAVRGSRRSPHEITVSVESSTRLVRLCVADTGAGMAENVKKRLFTPFFSSKTSERGTGLGLFICAEFVESWGGSIKVDSRVGAGSRFCMTLPAASD